MLEGILAYVGIGSNIGDPLRNCRQAIARLSDVSGITLERESSFYKTEPVLLPAFNNEHSDEIEKQNWFINAVVEIRTTLSARELLGTIQKIENNLGRVRTFRGSPRTIDLDLLLYGQEIIHQDDLIVPHPQMHQRRFVLEPLCEIASHFIHPVYGISMRGLKERLSDNKVVERLKNKQEGYDEHF
jgi:2-amino-4-hydroxy-6-hydroxymethyldihydropteridine diphosphokinase